MSAFHPKLPLGGRKSASRFHSSTVRILKRHDAVETAALLSGAIVEVSERPHHRAHLPNILYGDLIPFGEISAVQIIAKLRHSLCRHVPHQSGIPAFYQFDRTGGFRPGTYEAGMCCEMESGDLRNIGETEFANIFRRGSGFKVELDEADGRQLQKDDIAKIAFIFDPIEREVVLVAVQEREEKILRAPLKKTHDGKHVIEAHWKPNLSLKVDGEPASRLKGNE